ncbi:RNase P modulator RnpM [Clostridium sp. WILCCON 0269]|uniref:RNase P modulator RnpM n=1 Tax=Candidatus Clostridium eludens TaxID=3381663 RepID=A0ABW8SL43_9CLOT
MKKKKAPQRMCTGCMEMKPKKELIRIVKNKEGEVFVDPTGKKNGRGAYICRDIQCLEKALKNKRIQKNLEIQIDEALCDSLKEQIENEK